jgi:CBS domain-containing protein
LEVQEIMTKDVISVSSTMPVKDALDLLLRHRIHGAPVVDGSGRLLEMVSFVDLAAMNGATVQDIMVTDPVWAPADAPIKKVAALMLDKMARRIPIVTAGRVVGVISPSDIIELFFGLHKELERPRGRATLSKRRRRVHPDADAASRGGLV